MTILQDALRAVQASRRAQEVTQRGTYILDNVLARHERRREVVDGQQRS